MRARPAVRKPCRGATSTWPSTLWKRRTGLFDPGRVGEVEQRHGPCHLANAVVHGVGVGDAARIERLVVEVALAAKVEAEGAILDPVRADLVSGRGHGG